jgi:O-antigen/teichoic acid export membrane protein
VQQRRARPAEQGERQLARVQREGLAWFVANLAFVRVGGIVVTLLLRRLLGPGVSGLFDLAVTPYRFFDSVRNFGVGPVLVYDRGLSRGSADTAWTFNLLLAIALTIVAEATAGPIAHYYGHPGIERLIRILAITYVLTSLASVHGYLLLRRLDFRARSIPGVGQVVIAGVIAVVAAVWTTGTGPLLIREVLSAAVGSVLLWSVCPYLPRLRIDTTVLRRQLRYSVWLGAGLTSLYVSQNADVFIAGHVIHRAADVGFYTTSWRLSFLLVGAISLTVSSVVFPALSQTVPGSAEFGETMLRAVRQTAFAVLPASLCLAAIAPVVVVPLLGSRWGIYRPDYLIISGLALYGGVRALTGVFFEGYKAVGRPWLIAAYNLVKAAIIVPAMIVAAPHGIGALALVYLPVSLIEIPAAVWVAHDVLGTHVRSLAAAIQAPFLAALVSAALTVGAEVLCLRGLHSDDGVALLLGAVTSIVCYFAVLRALDPGLLRETREIMVRGLLVRSSNGEVAV